MKMALIGIDFFWAAQNIDMDNAILDPENHLMNAEIAAEMLNIMKGFKCLVIIASDEPTGVL